MEKQSLEELIVQFQEEIQDKYLNSAKLLASQGDYYASSVLGFIVCDMCSKYMSQIKTHKARLCQFFTLYFNASDREAEAIYDRFRNGLMHEGRAKKGGVFNDKFATLISVSKGTSTFNPLVFIEMIDRLVSTLDETVVKDRKVSKTFSKKRIVDV